MSKNQKIILGVTGILIVVLIVFTVLFQTNFFKQETPSSSDNPTNEGTTTEPSTSTNTYVLDDYSDDIHINNGGEYQISGSFTHSIIVNSSADVILNLDNVTISNKTTAGIINLGSGSLTVHTLEGSVNEISDGGESEYDGAIYSESHLILSGSGTLNVTGNQKEGEGIATTDADITIESGTILVTSNDDGLNAGGDRGGIITINDGVVYINAGGDGIDSNNSVVINGGTVFTMGSSIGGDAGIDTDNGYTINGGVVVAVGSDMLESPLNTSTQNTICFTLDSVISEGTFVTLVDSNNKSILSFTSDKNFKTIVISSYNLTSGTYRLFSGGTVTGNKLNNIYLESEYSGGSAITVNNATSFTTTGVVTTFGSSMR